MQIGSGTQLGPYEVIELLGKGGMGEVWLARDPKLDRDVAIKVLPELMARDRERVLRFEREAKLLASLNHSNIAQIYGFEESDDKKFLVLEYVEGETLAARIKRGALPVDEALDVCKQIAEGLEAAHEKGVIHRDLKPGNVMVTPDGTVKVLDFGLARAMQDDSDSELADSNSPTITADFTRPGVVLGTAPYMSPEQARGRPLDKRTDIWSFGVVLYECLTGIGAFTGETTTDVIAKIMERDPDYAALPDRTPPRVRDLLHRCLEKHSKRRLRDIGDALLELDQSLTSREWSTTAITAAERGLPNSWPARIAIGVACVLLLLAAGYAGWFAAGRQAPVESGQINKKFTKITDQMGAEVLPSLSPDGRSIVYCSNEGGNWDIYSMRVGGYNPRNLTARFSEHDFTPVFSPDGQRIAFRSERQGGGLFVMGATGESPRRLTDFGFDPAWHPDGRRVFFATEGIRTPDSRQSISALWSVVVETGETTRIYDGDAVQPNCSPSGHRIAYWTNHKGGQRDLFTISASGGDPVAVTDDAATDWNPVWSPDGRYLCFGSNRGGVMNIWRVRIDERSGERLGGFEAITSGVTAVCGRFSIARDGKRIAYTSAVVSSNIFKVAFDSETGTIPGEPVPVTRSSTLLGSPDVSPDGERIVCVSRGKQEDLFILNADGNERLRLTNDKYKDRGPRWSPDGRRIAFYSDRGGHYGIWVVNSDGSKLEKLIDREQQYNVPVWSPDGTRIALMANSATSSRIVDLTGNDDDRGGELLPRTDDTEAVFLPRSWSPDGAKLLGGWVKDGKSLGTATYSLETGTYEEIPEAGSGPWLADSRRFVFVRQGNLFLCDSATKEVSQILSLSPDTISGVAVGPGDREIYFSISSLESDIWLIELE